jgi:hypothetical protein
MELEENSYGIRHFGPQKEKAAGARASVDLRQ